MSHCDYTFLSMKNQSHARLSHDVTSQKVSQSSCGNNLGGARSFFRLLP